MRNIQMKNRIDYTRIAKFLHEATSLPVLKKVIHTLCAAIAVCGFILFLGAIGGWERGSMTAGMAICTMLCACGMMLAGGIMTVFLDPIDEDDEEDDDK